MFFKIGILKNFVIFTGKHLCWSLFLIKLTQKTSKKLKHRCFLVNIAEFLRTLFLRTPPVAASAVLKKFVDSQENIGGGGSIHLYFFTNTTEFNKMLMCY